MEYCIYKLNFKTPVHFGNGRLSGSNNTFFADTLFSALYKEALKLFGEGEAYKLYNGAKNGEILISDAMPYYKDTLFIPKPIIPVKGDKNGNSSLKKKFKKLKYIPVNDLDAYMSGEYEPTAALDILDKLGKSDLRTYVSVNEFIDNEPYSVGIYEYNKACGLYFIAGTNSQLFQNMLDDIMNSLAYAGIGGKISAGFGKFDYKKYEADDDILKRLNSPAKTYISLSISMADDNELERTVAEASYELIKRSGFAASEIYSSKPMKKRDFYCFKGGSCFNYKFKGDVFDVSSNGSHSVYRYAKPMFLAIK